MKNILLLFLCLLSINLIGQVERQPNLTAKYFASQSGGGSGFWQLTGTFTDDAGIYDASGVQVGDIVFFSDGTYTFFLPVTEIVSATHPTLVVKVSNVGITQISSVPSGMKAIFHPTSKGYFPFVSGISNADQQVYNEYLMSLLDNSGGGTNRTKPDTTIFAYNYPTANLTDKTDSLGGRGMVTIVVTKSNGVNANPILPAITDTIFNTKFKVKLYAENPNETVGMFQGDLGFVDGFDGTNYVDRSGLILINDLEEYTFWPVEDSNGYHWAYSKSGADRLNTIYTASDSITNGDRYLKLAADGSQNLGFGYFPDFPNVYADGSFGSYISPNYGGQMGLIWKPIGQNRYTESYLSSYDFRVHAQKWSGVGGNNFRVDLESISFNNTSNDGSNRYFGLDSTGLYYGGSHFVPRYNIFPKTTRPSTTPGRNQTLNWMAGVPTFQDRYVSDTLWSDVNLKMDKDLNQNFSLGYFDNFPNPDYSTNYGLFISPYYWGSVSIYNKKSNIEVYENDVYLSYTDYSNNRAGGFYLRGEAKSNYLWRKHAPYLSSVNKYGGGVNGGQFLNSNAIESINNVFYTKAGTYSGVKSQIDTAGATNGTIVFSATRDTIDYNFTGKNTASSFTLDDFSNGAFVVQHNRITATSPTLPTKKFEVGRMVNSTKTELFSVDYQKYLGDAVRFYNKYNLTNATPGTGKVTHTWDNGTPGFTEIKRDTTVSYNNLDYNLLSSGLTSTQIRNRYNNIEITGYVPSSGVTSDALLLLPAPDAAYNQCTIWLTALDENATYGIGVSATLDGIAQGNGTYTDAYSLTAGQTLRIRCKIDPKSGTSTYKWFLN